MTHGYVRRRFGLVPANWDQHLDQANNRLEEQGLRAWHEYWDEHEDECGIMCMPGVTHAKKLGYLD